MDSDGKGIDLKTLVQKLEKLLPSYARPIFLRIVDGVQVTGTYKLQKSKLKQEGFDVEVIKDQLFYFDRRVGQYLVFDKDKYERVTDGEIKM